MAQNRKRVILYGVLLGVCMLALEWLDYTRLARSHSLNIFVFLVARFAAEMRKFKVQYANPLYRVPMTLAEILPVGLLRNSAFMPQRSGNR